LLIGSDCQYVLMIFHCRAYQEYRDAPDWPDPNWSQIAGSST